MAAKNWLRYVKHSLFDSHPWVLGGFAAILSVGMWHIGLWEPLERLGYKTLFELREIGIGHRINWDERLVVIAIDAKSLKEYGQFPWPRDRYVQLLTSLQKSPPAVIGFDILWIDPSPLDAKLAVAIAASGNVVLARAKEGEEPLPELSAAAAGEGQIIHLADTDNISRRTPLYYKDIPNFGLEIIRVYHAAKGLGPLSRPEPDSEAGEQNVWVNWPGRMESVPTYSFIDVVEGRVPQQDLADKVVVVGFVATGEDGMVSPYEETTGVYLHVALIDNLLNDRLLRRLPRTDRMVLLLLLGPATSWLLLHRSMRDRIMIALVLPVAWLGIAVVAFSFYQWWIPISAPIGTMLLATIIIQLRDQYEKQQLMSLFEKHVAPETANLIWQRKGEIIEDGELQAQEMVATVLFMDIRSFTSISEKLPPRKLLSWLNQYLDAMTDCIMDHDGVIDKYIGDAIMAVFGIPFAHTQWEEIQQDALNAVAASMDMHARLRQLNEQLQAEGKPLIQFGIGVHTGSVIAGSVGGSRRLNYSVLGDTVNIAARLESMNKELTVNKPYKILLTNETFDYVSGRYLGEQVTTIQLRGRQQETIIYTILGERSPPA